MVMIYLPELVVFVRDVNYQLYDLLWLGKVDQDLTWNVAAEDSHYELKNILFR